MKRSWFAILLTSVLAFPAAAGWRDWVSPSKNWKRAKKGYNKVENYFGEKVEKAKAEQAKEYGLKVPENLNSNKRLIILIHGMDSGPGVWWGMAERLKKEGRQYGFFNYADDDAVASSAQKFGEAFASLRAAHPNLKVDLITHSLGGVIARAYIEGDAYAGGIDKFIALGPPNQGSRWADCRWMLESRQHWWMMRNKEGWSPVWMWGDGSGQAGDDIEPGSKFLKDLNARPRREGVSYTIIAGNHDVTARWGADAVLGAKGIVPNTNLWGVRQARSGLSKLETRLRHQAGAGDGVVSVESSRLEGVEDHIVLPADHNALAMEIDGKEPVAWDVVKKRLGD